VVGEFIQFLDRLPVFSLRIITLFLCEIILGVQDCSMVSYGNCCIWIINYCNHQDDSCSHCIHPKEGQEIQEQDFGVHHVHTSVCDVVLGENHEIHQQTCIYYHSYLWEFVLLGVKESLFLVAKKYFTSSSGEYGVDVRLISWKIIYFCWNNILVLLGDCLWN
jgi:hypothetical protein